MRRTLLGLLLAATAAMPAMVDAQQAPTQQRRGQWSNRGGGDGARAERLPEAQQAQQEQPAQQPPEARRWDGGERAQFRAGSPRRDGQDEARGERRVERQPEQQAGQQAQQQYGQQRRFSAPERFGRPEQAGWQAAQGGRQQRQGWSDRTEGRGGWQPADAGRRYDARTGRDGVRDGNRFADRGQWNRNWRGNDRYDYQDYRSGNRGAFHLPRYYAPAGWGGGSRRVSVGIRLSSILFGQNYWIDDPDDYRLPPAYGPYRWVRYYDDALLVDLRGGYVVDTVHDIFW